MLLKFWNQMTHLFNIKVLFTCAHTRVYKDYFDVENNLVIWKKKIVLSFPISLVIIDGIKQKIICLLYL